MRVVSLLPAATEIVAAVGAAEALVGVSHACDVPQTLARVARVTSTEIDAFASPRAIDEQVRAMTADGEPIFGLDEGLIAALAPDVIFTQALCDVCAVTESDVRALAAQLTPPPRVVTLSGTSLDGVLTDIGAVADAVGRGAAGAALVAALRLRVRSVHETLKAAQAPRPRVLVLEWTDPVYLGGHWVPELVKRAGGIDVLGVTGAHSMRAELEALSHARAEIVCVAPCGYDLGRAAAEAQALLADPAWRWLRACDVWALDGNALTSRPGPRLVDTIETMARIFNPSLFPPTDARLAERMHDARGVATRS